MVTRERLVEAIRAAYTPTDDLDAGGPGCGCCWGNTCPGHAAEAVLAAFGADTAGRGHRDAG